jgi:SAM-dependent methyltransferase
MPTINQNLEKWGKNYNWPQAGDEWSKSWGGATRQWHGSVLPRIERFLPAPTILEIAPGFGRWTQFLKQYCDCLIGVDLNTNCIEACRRRFADSAQLRFYRNDGKSLEMVPNNSIDFIFSFDSLVHAEADVIGAYLAQFNRILRPEGVGFIHHSNYGAHTVSSAVMAMGRVSGLRRLLWRFRLGGIQPNYHSRAETMSAVRFRSLCAQHGIRCIEQEIVNWGASFLNDCFSTVVRGDSITWPQQTRIIENLRFMEEAARIKST